MTSMDAQEFGKCSDAPLWVDVLQETEAEIPEKVDAAYIETVLEKPDQRYEAYAILLGRLSTVDLFHDKQGQPSRRPRRNPNQDRISDFASRSHRKHA